MTYAPVVPFGGLAGWAFLTRTREAQKTAFASSPAVQRDEAYFRDRIGGISSAEELVSDRRLLSVALGAFGLEDDINNRYFIRKVLEDGTLDPKALGNKLADKRYLELSKAFGFGDYATPRTKLSDFAEKVLARYETQSFEQAVGDASDEMRLAMNAERELATLAGRDVSDDTRWYSILGSAPLRQVVETAFGLPRSFSGIDLDQQLAVMKDRSERYLGSSEAAQFSDPEAVQSLLRLYLLRSESSSAQSSPAAAALALLGQPGSSQGILSLLI